LKLGMEHGFLLADLERLFHGHGTASNEPWFVQVIEPNLAGATAVAEHWYERPRNRPMNNGSPERERPRDALEQLIRSRQATACRYQF
jgi:hypothetical protein